MLMLGLMLLLGLSLLPIIAASSGRRSTAVSYWALAAFVLWATGMAQALGAMSWPFLGLAHVAGPVSASLFLLGARCLAGLGFLSWIPRVGTLGALATGATFYAMGRGPASAVQIGVSFPLLAASAWLVCVHAWRSRAPVSEKALGASLVALAVLTPLDLVVRLHAQAEPLLLMAWTTLAFSIAFLTLATLAQRANRRARALTSELREQTTALELERRTLLSLVESAPLGIALADPPGSIRYLNACGAELMGIGRPEDWQGRDAREIADAIEARLSEESRESLQAMVSGEFSELDTPPKVDLELDEGAQILELINEPVRADDGSCLGRLWICRDVTEERKMVERFSQAHRMETVGTLAGGIAHDFNNQLTAILGSIDLMIEDLSGEDRRCAEAIERSALHCAELTQGLLTFAKRRAPNPEPILVESVVQEVVSLLRPGLAPGTEVTASVAEDAGSILATADDLRRVLMNLGVNARDAISAGGHIQIEARRAPAEQGERIELIVSDDGVGMDDDTRRRIFDPFFTTKGPGKGTGLGLSVIYGIAENHGAKIEVESALGKGSTFRLSWPAAPGEALRVSPPSRVQEAPERIDATVLLGEDNPLVRDSARGMLERAGYRVLEAVDGPGTVECFRERESEVDLLLLDLAMPGCSGLEALAQIRSLAPGRPAILMSGNPDPFKDQVPEGSDFLLKPFRSEELVERVQEVLARQPTL